MNSVLIKSVRARGVVVPVGRFSLTAGGSVELTVLDPERRSWLEGISLQIVSHSLNRRVLPSEGELFLRGLCENFSASTYVIAVAED